MDQNETAWLLVTNRLWGPTFKSVLCQCSHTCRVFAPLQNVKTAESKQLSPKKS